MSEAAVEAGPEDGAVVGAALRDGFGTYGIGPMVTEATTDVEAELAADVGTVMAAGPKEVAEEELTHTIAVGIELAHCIEIAEELAGGSVM